MVALPGVPERGCACTARECARGRRGRRKKFVFFGASPHSRSFMFDGGRVGTWGLMFVKLQPGGMHGRAPAASANANPDIKMSGLRE